MKKWFSCLVHSSLTSSGWFWTGLLNHLIREHLLMRLLHLLKEVPVFRDFKALSIKSLGLREACFRANSKCLSFGFEMHCLLTRAWAPEMIFSWSKLSQLPLVRKGLETG